MSADDTIHTKSITDTSPSDWRYVSEGGATIVFSYVGPPNPEYTGTVLRLRKSAATMGAYPLGASRSREPSPIRIDDTTDEPDDPMIEYQRKCMERLIPREHLARLESVRLERGWLKDLVAMHDVVRPTTRSVSDHVDLTRKKGVLATDLVGGDWLAVEIKPKWAFLPSLTHLSDATRSVKSRTCRFCMHSHLKDKSGKAVALGYCPLDLFSGDRERIRNAIHSLWDSWVQSNGTVNNLKVFVKGKTIKPSQASSMLAIDMNQSQSSEDLREAFATAILPLLAETRLLRILSKLQRTLDVLDIEGLSDLWRFTEISAPSYRTDYASYFEHAPAQPLFNDDFLKPPSSPIGVSSQYLSSPEPTIEDWSDFLDTYLSPNHQYNHNNPSPENLRYYLLAYLLSATFKDCSIILRLDPLQPGNPPTGPVRPERVTIIDLDPKSMSRLRKWEKLDREISQAYMHEADPRNCIDGYVEDM